eukprot:355947-Chlamydomonas_euryale.AAC.8
MVAGTQILRRREETNGCVALDIWMLDLVALQRCFTGHAALYGSHFCACIPQTLERFAKDDQEKEAAATGASTPAAGAEVDMGDAQKAVKRAVARAAKKGRKQAGVAKMQE